MNDIGKPERVTQERVIKLFVEELGYRYLGDWTDRDANSNVEEGLLSAWLTMRGYTASQINAALYKLRTEADNHSRDLYGNNKEVYKLLRYGVQVKTEASEPTATVQLIDWEQPGKNDFAIAEEVTLLGNHERRPDLVLYVNGIAVGVIELKNSRVSIGDDRQTGARHTGSSDQALCGRAWLSLPGRLDRPGRKQQRGGRASVGLANKARLHHCPDQCSSLQAAHRGGQP